MAATACFRFNATHSVAPSGARYRPLGALPGSLTEAVSVVPLELAARNLTSLPAPPPI